jgi:hypothetical protein
MTRRLQRWCNGAFVPFQFNGLNLVCRSPIGTSGSPALADPFVGQFFEYISVTFKLGPTVAAQSFSFEFRDTCAQLRLLWTQQPLAVLRDHDSCGRPIAGDPERIAPLARPANKNIEWLSLAVNDFRGLRFRARLKCSDEFLHAADIRRRPAPKGLTLHGNRYTRAYQPPTQPSR